MQDFTQHSQGRSMDQAAISAEAVFFQRIYTWMCAGLFLTAAIAYTLAKSVGFLTLVYNNQILFFIFMFATIIFMPSYISAKMESISPATGKGLFLAFSALMGLFLAVIVASYSQAVLFTSFVATAGVYGAMAVYGFVTKRSLQGWGSFLFMGVMGIFLVSIVNIFIGSSLVSFGIGIIGVFIFAGLTAYQHQALRVIHATGLDGTADGESRVVIVGALTLYLTVINLFLMFLRIFGAGRE